MGTKSNDWQAERHVARAEDLHSIVQCSEEARDIHRWWHEGADFCAFRRGRLAIPAALVNWFDRLCPRTNRGASDGHTAPPRFLLDHGDVPTPCEGGANS